MMAHLLGIGFASAVASGMCCNIAPKINQRLSMSLSTTYRFLMSKPLLAFTIGARWPVRLCKHFTCMVCIVAHCSVFCQPLFLGANQLIAQPWCYWNTYSPACQALFITCSCATFKGEGDSILWALPGNHTTRIRECKSFASELVL